MILEKIKQNQMAAVNILYCLFPIIALITEQYQGALWLGIIMTVQFIVGYIWMCFIDLSKRLILQRFILIMHYVGITYFIFYFGGYFFYFYFYSAYILPFVFHATFKSFEIRLYMLSMVLSVIIETIKYPELVIVMLPMLIILLGMTIANVSNVKQHQLENEILKKNEYINMLIAENERARISQDLHDSLGHIFASLSIKSELAAKLLENERIDQAKTEVESINQLSRDAIVKVRGIVEDVKLQSFVDEVRSMEMLLNHANIVFAFKGAERTEILSPTKQATLAMVLREMVNNIIKHAQATNVIGRIDEKDDKMTLTLQDDGIGMTEVTDKDFQSIRQRVRTLDGTLNVESLEQGLLLMITFSRKADG
ncbi:sensor histidine kinase [Staphylococcus americanisciuri]|uniref:histidine kinase n=1 Tax=Staphylococcus americanisciuri TaxID=2973940 RepID=A0ABT2F139_9STAP|nr:histidine kinase [Staphylococcus americanisciuri]MCS4486173.1 histidine kinase [Staphylococcus americanisciuri]